MFSSLICTETITSKLNKFCVCVCVCFAGIHSPLPAQKAKQELSVR